MKSNKKQIISILAVLTMAILLSCAFVACDKVDTDKTGTDIVADYKVTIHPNNGQGDIVWDITKEIPTITKDGYHIAGYFLDAQLTISTTLESLKATGITKNIDVYVKWEEDVCEHVEVTDVAVAPTCTEKGLTEGKHCSKCGKILTAQTEIDALGHDLENHAGQPATCTEKGWKAYVTCKREGCGYTTYQEIPALGHTEVIDDAIAPTCTEKGKTEGKHCSVCNTIIVAQTDIAALGHDLEHHNKKDATCTEPGWEAYDTCKRDGCTYTTYKAIAATGHTPSNWIVDVAATCENDGSVYKECTVCHVELERDTTSKLGHDLEHHNKKDATCTESGWEAYDTCKRVGCGYTTYQEIPALGHKYSQDWSNDKTYHWHASTCGHDVVSDKGKHTFDSNWVCTECAYADTGLHGVELCTNTLELEGTDIFGKVSNATSTFSFINEISIADSATYIVSTDINGSNVIRTKTVSLGIGDNTFYILVENGKDLGLYTVVIRRRPMYSVSFNVNGGTSVSSQTIEEDHFATEPTTERRGYTFDKWDYDFSKPIIKDTTITASWNIITYNVYYDFNVPSDSISQDVDNSMNVTTYTVEDAITFQTPSRKGYRFTGWDKNIEKGTIGDVTVTASWEVIVYDIVYDFSDADSVSKATNNAQNPSKYTVEDTITFEEPSRGYYTFSAWNIDKIVPGTTETQTIIASWIAEQHTINYVLSNGWTNSENNITAYTIEDKTITLYNAIKGESLFCGWYLDEEYKNYIATIDASTMRDYTVYAYADDSATKGLSIENCNVKGYFGTLTDVVIPSYYKGNSVTSIGSSAFAYCTGLSSITIPDSVTSIGDSAFKECTGLTSITIPDSVTSIGYSAFSGCSSLESITIPFVGTKAGVTSSDTYQYPFGYIFGTSSYTGGVATWQYYFGDSTSLTTPDTYYIPSSLKSVTVTGGSILYGAFYNCKGLTSVTIPNSVTSIGNYAFSGCSGLTSVTIGNSVTSIGSGVFNGCTGLMSITIPNSVTSIGNYTFSGCSGLTSVTIPDSVTSIGDYAFRGCSGLTSVTIPDSVTSIGDYAFRGCSGLTSVTIPDIVTSIGDYAFCNCTGLTSITIPDSVTSIGSYAFSGCSSLESITIPFVGAKAGVTSSDTYQYPFGYIFGTSSGVATTQYYYGDSTSSTTSTTYYIPSSLKSVTVTGGNILYGAFYNCTGLTSVTIPDSVTSIGSDAFRGCTGLSSITIPDIVTSIGDSAFSGCSGLTSVTIGNSVTNIGSSAFSGCRGLASIIIPDSVTSIGSRAFSYCTGLTSITIPDSVTSIGSRAFDGCSGLTSITIPAGVTSIGDSAFSSCGKLQYIYITDIAAWCNVSGLENLMKYGSSDKKLYLNDALVTSVTISDGVTSIPDDAFRGCTGLTSVTIPDSVTSIGSRAFYGCSGLTSITIPDSVTSIGDYAFYNCTGLTSIIVDEGNTKYHSAGNCLIETATKTLILGCNTSVIPTDGSVTSIGDSAFYRCTGLASIIIPDSVTSIGNSAFSYCNGLTSVTIPDSVTSIGNSAFYDCTGLTSITIPDSVTHIDDYAFNYCTSLTTINFNGTMEQWNAVSKGTNWKTNVPATQVVCTDGTVSI